MITLEIFEDRLDRWGGALDRWPADSRHEAEALLAASRAARALLASMVEVEAALAPIEADVVDTTTARRFAAVATRRAQDRPVSPMLRRAGWGAAIAAALALGIVVGQVDLGPLGQGQVGLGQVGLGPVGLGAMHDDNPDRLLASALNPGVSNADVD